MRKALLSILAIAAVAIVPSVLVADGKAMGITGSPHDFSDGLKDEATVMFDETWNHRGEICRVCHVPHDHNRNQALFSNGLLWDHALSAATYEMYAEQFPSSIDGFAWDEPQGVSKLCLGCHDGTVGIDQFDNKTAGPGTVFIGDYDGGFQIPGASITDIGGAKNLSGTHPISIFYDPGGDPGLNPISTAMGTSGNIEDVLWNGYVECSSCHDVHDSIGEAVADTHLLRVGNNTSTGTASGLCLTCHKK